MKFLEMFKRREKPGIKSIKVDGEIIYFETKFGSKIAVSYEDSPGWVIDFWKECKNLGLTFEQALYKSDKYNIILKHFWSEGWTNPETSGKVGGLNNTIGDGTTFKNLDKKFGLDEKKDIGTREMYWLGMKAFYDSLGKINKP